VKDKLGAEPGGEDKPKASQHQQPATTAVHSTTFAQLQAKGRKPASTSLLVHVSSIGCYLIKPSVWQRYALPKLIIGKVD
jgi:hypothetical protein